MLLESLTGGMGLKRLEEAAAAAEVVVVCWLRTIANVKEMLVSVTEKKNPELIKEQKYGFKIVN